jgi:hypothetical protein
MQGRGIPPKYYQDGWFPPVDVPTSGYGGPYPMERFEADYGAFGRELLPAAA